MVDRPEVLRWLAATGAVAVAGKPAGAGEEPFPDARYASAMVIDALGAPGALDPEAPEDAPLSTQALADVKASGITAVNVTVGEVGNGSNRFEKTVDGIAQVEREIARHPDVFVKVLRASDLGLAKASGRMGLIYGFQDTTMLEGDLARLAVFQGLGVRISQPTYNRRNLIGDGCLEEADGGLSRLGHDFIAEMNRLHMLVDLSHAGRRTIAQGIAASTQPVAITHTGCRALVDVPRNTDDSSLRALADKGGVVGIYFMPFLRMSGQPHPEDLIRHLEHAVNVCGEDHVGLGTDGFVSGIQVNDAFWNFHRKFVEKRQKEGVSAPGEAVDVLNFVPEYNEPRRFKTLADDLTHRGWSAGRIEKILGANFAKLFSEVWES